jgi:hypothetical protein
MNWIQDRWKEARGNFIGGVAILVATGLWGQFTGKWKDLWKWFSSLCPSTHILSILLFLVTAALAVMTTLWHRARKETIRFIIDGAESVPEFIRPRREATAPIIPKPDTSRMLAIHTITLRCKETPEPSVGIHLWLENTSLEPVNDCQLILTSLGSYHKGQRAFRTPTFNPTVLIRAKVLEPEGDNKLSDGAWLVHSSNIRNFSIDLPSGIDSKTREETSGGVWKALLQIQAGANAYSEYVCFSWKPGLAPQIEDSAEYAF